jgi:hypothetical protein
MSEYTLIQDDEGDWIGLYKDGRLVQEGHSFEPSRLLQLVGVRHDMIWDVDLSEEGSLPQTLEEAIHLPGAVVRTVEPK